ncbi:MAG: hypothetical protein L0Y56_05685 [Nitrospira sp.]|nr:hypothetical protein [Nitrospira sp.]
MAALPKPNGVTDGDWFPYTFRVSRAEDDGGNALDTTYVRLGFNFTGITRSQLMIEAVKNIAIRLQASMRSACRAKSDVTPMGTSTKVSGEPNTTKRWLGITSSYNDCVIEVGETLSRRKVRLSRVAKIVKDSEKASATELEQAVVELQKKLAGLRAAK